ncbi:unnamed protein product [Orchesella dallaii]|uniref:Uncharacterized protein n=1 Tax=Orchesella dallaii TaxID=48710 RepID=A0ABP1Q385_9HEXA
MYPTLFCFTIWKNKDTIPNQWGGNINRASGDNNNLAYNHYKSNLQLVHVKWLFDTCTNCIKLTKTDEISDLAMTLHKSRKMHCFELDNKFDFKIVIFDFYTTPQVLLDYTFKNFPEMRNYHTDPPLYGPFHIVSKLLSDKVNATLLTKAQAELENISTFSCPLVNPAVQIYEMGGMPLIKFWNTYRKRKVILARQQSLGFNFAYCSRPSIIHEKAWNVSVLVNAFEFKVWAILLLAILCISLKIATRILDGVLIFQYKTFGYVIYTISSAIISTLTLPYTQKSGLFLLWMFMSIILVNYYTGSITSRLISPPEEDAMTEISQVVKNNYSIIFDNIVHLGIMKATVQTYTKPQSGGKFDIRKDLQAIHSLLERLSPASLIKDQTEYIRNVSYTEKVVILYLWPFIMKAINEANNLIAMEQPIVSKRRHCYVGKQIIPSGEVFFGFGNHGSARIQQVFQSTVEAGIYLYWMTEFCQMSYAKRVQDRRKVVSPTQIKYDFLSTVSALRMEGKVLTVFFVWAVCLAGCVMSSVIEVFCSNKNNVISLGPDSQSRMFNTFNGGRFRN